MRVISLVVRLLGRVLDENECWLVEVLMGRGVRRGVRVWVCVYMYVMGRGLETGD